MVSGGQGITVSPCQGAGQAGGKQRQPQPWASGTSIGTGQAGASPGHGPAGVLIRSSEKNGGQTWPWNHSLGRAVEMGLNQVRMSACGWGSGGPMAGQGCYGRFYSLGRTNNRASS